MTGRSKYAASARCGVKRPTSSSAVTPRPQPTKLLWERKRCARCTSAWASTSSLSVPTGLSDDPVLGDGALVTEDALARVVQPGDNNDTTSISWTEFVVAFSPGSDK